MSFQSKPLKYCSRHGFAIFFLIGSFILNIWYFSKTAPVGFHFHDWSGFWDASWRVMRGQRIYTDFYYHSGPVHPYLMALFFLIFGFSQTGLVAHLAIINFSIQAMIFFILYGRIPVILAALTSLIGMFFYYWPYPHPYYDFTAHFFGSAAIFILVKNYGKAELYKSWLVLISAGLCIGFAVFSKINVGGIYGLIVLAYLFTLPHRFHLNGYYLSGCLISLLMILALIHSPKDFLEYFLNYANSQAGRFSLFVKSENWMKCSHYWIPLIFTVPLVLFFNRKNTPLLILSAGVCAAGIFSHISSATFIMLDIYKPLLGLSYALHWYLIYDSYNDASSMPVKALHAFVVFALLMNLILPVLSTFVIVRDKVVNKGAFITSFIYNHLPEGKRYQLKQSSFKGWFHHPVIGSALDGVIAFVKSEIPEEDSFLILNQWQWVYSLADRESFKGVPFHWDIPTGPPPGEIFDRVRNLIMDNPPQWILIEYDGIKPGFPNEITHYLNIDNDFFNRHYKPERKWGRIMILCRTW